MRRLFCLSCLAFLFVLSAACSRLDPPQTSGELVVAVRNDPVFYLPPAGDEPASGFETDLLQAFAAELNVRLRLVPVRDLQEQRRLLRDGKVHFAAALPVEPEDGVSFAAPLHVARQLLVRHAEDIGPDEVEELEGHIVEVVADSPVERALMALDLPAQVVQVRAANGFDLLARVSEGKADLAATDSAHFDVAVNFYPDIAIAQVLPGTANYAWAFPAGDEELRRRADAFILRIRSDGMFARIRDRYYGHIKRIGPGNMAQFLIAIQTRLPDFRADFQQAERLTGIDWRLLAALAYQESTWDPLATSPTGVRGIMMLTEDTADYLKVSNRLDPHQSIRAGARYLAEIRDNLPPETSEPDRTWLALSAYNLGMGHLNGARALAKGLNRDPNSWYEMKKVLPLLARPEYYQRLKSGRGRGGEAVIMVENIRNFYNVLTRFEPPLPPSGQASGARRSKPPSQGRKASGKVIVPSAFW